MNAHPKTKLLFVCQNSDQQAVARLTHLQADGYQTRLLEEGERAPIGSIALYTGHNDHWPSNFFRVAAHRLYPSRPNWAITTPFLVAVKPGSSGQMDRAVLELAHMYERWFAGDAGVTLPWETRNGPTTSYLELMENWLDLVAEAIGQEELVKLLASQRSTDQHRGRGGDVVYRHLAQSGRVVTAQTDLPTGFKTNKAYQKLTGQKLPVVSYGTSDLANVFELLEAIKLGHVLGLPVVFETYPGAHNLSYWLSGFMNPSLLLLGSKVWAADFGLEGNAKYTSVLTPETLPRLIKSAKLENIQTELTGWAGLPLWQVYQKAMHKVACELLAALGITVDFRFTTTEEMCKATGLWSLKARTLALTVEEIVGHNVVAFNKPDGSQVMTSQPMPDKTVSQLHKDGWWLGGAALYYMVFNMGKHGGLVVMIKDSTAGRVNMIAQKFFTPESDLYVAPVGLFRLTAEEQNEDWSIDPLVMLSLMRTWGPVRTTEAAQTIWNAMDVPMPKDHIGRKTVAKITNNGVLVRVQDT